MKNKNLTKKQRTELAHIRHKLTRGLAYLTQETIVLAQATEHPLGNAYTLNNPTCAALFHQPPHLSPIHKYVGSDIAGLHSALAHLNEFLEETP